ncbi:hypothetical protein I906_gp12 [Bacillus phage Curly]|uniref:Uncharacterized protein n=1 Tax=Bacillus phage Curly TaxID=2880541 RepID=M1IDG6_9CAUD|nr:hypothetical protein I906_gp12 [Bacillus phage Curly]AGE60699.1 hypothetical protein CURLY_12 [Bacillus phage Curly]
MNKLKVIVIIFVVCLTLGAISNLFGGNNETAKPTEEPKKVETKKEEPQKKKPTKDELAILDESFSRIVNDSEGVVENIVLRESGAVHITVKESVWGISDESAKKSFMSGIHQRVKMSLSGANIIKPKDSVLTKFYSTTGDLLAEKKLYGDSFKIKR